MTTFIGIDPSLTGTGIYVLGEHKKKIVVKTKAKERTEDRFNKIIKKIEKIYADYQYNGVAVGIEGFSYMSRGRGISQIYGLGWAIRMHLYNNGVTYYEVPPTVVKKFATGKGNSKKERLLLSAYKKYDIEFKDNNLCDAFFIAKITKFLHTKQDPELKYEQEALKKIRKDD